MCFVVILRRWYRAILITMSDNVSAVAKLLNPAHNASSYFPLLMPLIIISMKTPRSSSAFCRRDREFPIGIVEYLWGQGQRFHIVSRLSQTWANVRLDILSRRVFLISIIFTIYIRIQCSRREKKREKEREYMVYDTYLECNNRSLCKNVFLI